MSAILIPTTIKKINNTSNHKEKQYVLGEARSMGGHPYFLSIFYMTFNNAYKIYCIGMYYRSEPQN